MRPFIALAIATYVLLEAARPQLAQACSGLPCNLPAAFPVPEGGEVPANFGELTVFTESSFPRAAGYTLKLWEAGSPERLLRTVKVDTENQNRAQLGDLLTPGKSYVVEATSCGKEYAASFEASIRTLHFKLAQSASAPPTTLGALTVARHGPTAVAWGGGAGCYADLNTDAVDLTLDPSALPEAWRKLVNSYQLMVDGEPFSWTLTIGSDGYGPRDRARGFYFAEPGTFRAFTECEPSRSLNVYGGPAAPEQKQRGLGPGKHTLWVAARVPTSPAQIVESQPVEVELSCPEPDAGTIADGGTDAATSTGAAPEADAEISGDDTTADRGTPPAERAAVTEGSPSMAGSGADSVDHAATREAGGGCALSAATRGAHPAALGLLLLALALLRRKRAVRPRHTWRRSAD